MSSNSNSVYLGLSLSAVLAVAALVGLVDAAIVYSPSAVAAEAAADSVDARIKPVGEVTVTGQEAPAVETPAAAAPAPAAPAAAAAAPAAGGRSGEEIYNKICLACHLAGVANAPKLGDKAAWAPRIAKGIDGLLQSALQGLNAMPPKGTCTDCTDAELKGAIEYMVSHSK